MPRVTAKRGTVPLIDMASVTFEQFSTAMEELWAYTKKLRAERNWCVDFVITVRRLSEFVPRRLEPRAERLDIPAPDSVIPLEWLTEEGLAAYNARESQRYASELMLVRSRILGVVRDGNITLAEANACFARMGLPQHTPPNPDTAKWYTYMGSMHVRVPASMTRDDVNITLSADALKSVIEKGLPDGIVLETLGDIDQWTSLPQVEVSAEDIEPLMRR